MARGFFSDGAHAREHCIRAKRFSWWRTSLGRGRAGAPNVEVHPSNRTEINRLVPR